MDAVFGVNWGRLFGLDVPLITQEELMSLLREQGVEDLSDVERAYIEPDGRISVIAREEKTHKSLERKAG